MPEKRIPLATYRLQLNRLFGFADAERLLPYLADLGIDTIYASPIFRARPGSKHGYDIVDHNELNPDLGTAGDFDGLMDSIYKRGMGWVQDIVPNHMAFHHDNHMLMELLRLGKMSPYFDCFDIDWENPDERLSGCLMVPFLERPYGECLKRGDFELRLGPDGLVVTYKQHAFPLRIEDHAQLLIPAYAASEERVKSNQQVQRLIRAAEVLKILAGDPALGWNSRIESEVRTMWRLYSQYDTVREFVDRTLASVGGEALDDLLSLQRYVFACWRETAGVINYRRFFDVNGLIALAAHRAGAYRYTHGLVNRLVETPGITGLRVDHIDGLRDPEGYLRRLAEGQREVYTIVEKILSTGEQLRWWKVDGTTGYDFLNTVNGIFCRRENKEHFDRIYSEFTGMGADPRDVLYEKKKLVMNANLRADLDNLARWLAGVVYGSGQEVTPDGPVQVSRLREALVEMLAELPVYRTYLTPADQSWQDGTPLAGAFGRAEARNPDLQSELRMLASVLLAAPRLGGEPADDRERTGYVMTLQQYMGAVMAKGFEDTFLYVYNRLISLNEVGGDPIAFGTDLAGFHAFNLARSASYPHSLSATSTHDTKRGEDARARINVLSEIPDEWEQRLKHWARLNSRKKVKTKGEEVPDRNDEYALYQALVGSCPFETDDLEAYRLRIARYVRKAAREAKVHTRWRDPDAEYENGFTGFAESIITPSADNEFLKDFLAFKRRVAHYGAVNSLAQTLIKICAPGVPDFYQGSELWNLSLVDPDNRRPVDYAHRARLLGDLIEGMSRDPVGTIKECLENIGDGRVKLLLIHRALAARKANPYLFEKGNYIELRAGGELSEHLAAFARSQDEGLAVCIVPRFLTGVVGEGGFPLGLEVWGDTAVTLPAGAPRRWRDSISGQALVAADSIPVGAALRHFPVGLLTEDSE